MSLKDWLTRNEIYFKTVSATLISAMALTVSFSSLCVSSESRRIATLQADMARQKEMPVFRCRISLFQDPETQVYSKDDLTIENINSFVTIKNVRFLAFYKVEEVSGQGASTVLMLPVNGYYGAEFGSDMVRGPSADVVRHYISTVSEGNNTMAARLEREYVSKVHESHMMFSKADLERYVDVEYIDRFGETHSDAFFVNNFKQLPLESKKFEELEKVWWKTFNEGAFIDFDHPKDASIWAARQKLKRN